MYLKGIKRVEILRKNCIQAAQLSSGWGTRWRELTARTSAAIATELPVLLIQRNYIKNKVMCDCVQVTNALDSTIFKTALKNDCGKLLNVGS